MKQDCVEWREEELLARMEVFRWLTSVSRSESAERSMSHPYGLPV